MTRRVKLNKGEKFSLGNIADLSKIRVAFNWKPEVNLDASAFLVNEKGKIIDEADFVFYNSSNRSLPYDSSKFGNKTNWRNATAPTNFDGSVMGVPDNLVDYDGEILHVDLSRVRTEVKEIMFCLSLFCEQCRVNSFRGIESPGILIMNEKTVEELCSYNINEYFTSETAVVVGSLVRNDDG